MWIIDPGNEIVLIHRNVTKLHKNDELSGGEDVLPGFAFRVAELLPEAA